MYGDIRFAPTRVRLITASEPTYGWTSLCDGDSRAYYVQWDDQTPIGWGRWDADAGEWVAAEWVPVSNLERCKP